MVYPPRRILFQYFRELMCEWYNTPIYMGSGCKIFVKRNCQLKVSSQISSACNEMWKGIELEEGDPASGIAGGFIYTTNAIIANAENCIKGHAMFTMDIRYTLFDRNCIGISIIDGPTIADNAYGNFYCIGSTFTTSSSPLLAPFPGQTLTSYTHGWAGISGAFTSLNIGDVLPAHKNTFSNLNCGIYLVIANLNIINTDLKDIRNYDNQVSIISKEYGIYNSSPIVPLTSQVGTNSSRVNVGLNFTNITKGIYMSGLGGSIYCCNMDNVNVGINLQHGGQGTTMNIDNNLIKCKDFGILIEYNQQPNFANLVWVSNNTILFNDVTTSVNSGYEIYAHDFNFTGTTSLQIVHNHIFCNVAGYMGIGTYNINNPKIIDNDIHINHSRTNGYGILVSNAPGSTIHCNYVQSNAIVASSNQVSFHNSTSPNSQYSCNYSANTYLGFRFDEKSNGTNFSSSEIHSHTFGLAYYYQYERLAQDTLIPRIRICFLISG